MKTLILVASCIAILCAGCQLFKPLRNPDSLDNASTQTWVVTADFDSGLHHTYDQIPESFSDFGIMSHGTIPAFTNLVAVSQNSPPLTCSLSAQDISTLRRAAPGGLSLVLCDGGIACLSPAIKRNLEKEILNHPYTRQEYFRLLKAQAQPALQWTRIVLTRR